MAKRGKKRPNSTPTTGAPSKKLKTGPATAVGAVPTTEVASTGSCYPKNWGLSWFDASTEPLQFDFAQYDSSVIDDACRQSKVWDTGPDLHEPHQVQARWLARRDVILAIASVLLSHRETTSLGNVYAPVDLLDVGSPEEVEALDPDVVPVGSDDVFLFPVVLDPDQRQRGGSAQADQNLQPRAALVEAELRGKQLYISYRISFYPNGATAANVDLGPFKGIAEAIIRRWSFLATASATPDELIAAAAQETRPCPDALL